MLLFFFSSFYFAFPRFPLISFFVCVCVCVCPSRFELLRMACISVSCLFLFTFLFVVVVALLYPGCTSFFVFIFLFLFFFCLHQLFITIFVYLLCSKQQQQKKGYRNNTEALSSSAETQLSTRRLRCDWRKWWGSGWLRNLLSWAGCSLSVMRVCHVYSRERAHCKSSVF